MKDPQKKKLYKHSEASRSKIRKKKKLIKKNPMNWFAEFINRFVNISVSSISLFNNNCLGQK